MLLDILIALVILVAVVIGFQRGLIQPLLTELFFVLALYLIFRNRDAYAALVDRVVHGGAVVDVMLALVIAVAAAYGGSVLGGTLHRMPVVRGVDGFLGVFAHALIALVALYMLISMLVILDQAFSPLTKATLTSAQVSTLSRALKSNPLTAVLVEQRDLNKLRDQAAAISGVARIDTTPHLNQVKVVYSEFVRPQLVGSRLAPRVVSIGSHIPLIGRVRQADLPR